MFTSGFYNGEHAACFVSGLSKPCHISPFLCHITLHIGERDECVFISIMLTEKRQIANMTHFSIKREHIKFVEYVSVFEIWKQHICNTAFLLQVHCYRAALEKILVKYWPHLRHTTIRSMKHTNSMTFTQ